jgi:hypothetical protein
VSLFALARPKSLNGLPPGRWGRRRSPHVEPVEDPEHADEAHRAEAHHHHADDALGLDEAAVEERHARRHEKHEGCRRDRPREVSAVHEILTGVV